MKLHQTISIILLGTSLSGCSSFMDSTNRYLFGDEEAKTAKTKPAPSQKEYNKLLNKYNNLEKKYNALVFGDTPANTQQFSQVEELSGSAGQVDTVDAFAKDIMSSSPMSTGQLSGDEVDQEIKYYKKGVALRINGNIDAALKVFQYLERSKTNQVRVRAKYHVAQIYIGKNQYDLALQVNEDIIKSEGFSGKVLKALEDSVLCASKLGLESKKLQYKSMLTDFFNIRI